MGLLDGIFGGGQKAAGYQKVLTQSDFTKTDHQTLPDITDYATVATYKCPAQMQIAIGFGDDNHPDSAGRLYIFMRTGEATPAEILGKIRILVTNYADTKRFVLYDGDGSILHGDLTDKNKKTVMSERRPMIGQDSYIKIQMMPTVAHVGAGAAADNVGWASITESLLSIPVTVYQ